MWIGAGSSQVGDYPIPLRGFALALFFVTQTLEEGPAHAGWGPQRAGSCVLASVCSEMSDRLKEHTGRANDR